MTTEKYEKIGGKFLKTNPNGHKVTTYVNTSTHPILFLSSFDTFEEMSFLTRFQIALNSKDFSLITSELISFRDAILREHEIDKESPHCFGYHGRGFGNPLTPIFPSSLTGSLAEYIDKSPQLEELFSVFNLVGRDENRPLSALHSEVLAIILFCCVKTQPSLASHTIYRLLQNHNKTLQHQISSGHTTLIHSTLGLLLSIARTSFQSSRDLFQRLILTSQGFSSLIQKGKVISFTREDGSKLETNSKSLFFLLLSTILLQGNDLIAAEVLSNSSSLYRKILYNITNDSSPGIRNILQCTRHVLEHASINISLKMSILDGIFLDKLALLYSHEEEEIQLSAHEFLTFYVAMLAKAIHGRKELFGLASLIIKKSTPHLDLRHKEVLLSSPLFFLVYVLNYNDKHLFVSSLAH